MSGCTPGRWVKGLKPKSLFEFWLLLFLSGLPSNARGQAADDGPRTLVPGTPVGEAEAFQDTGFSQAQPWHCQHMTWHPCGRS